MHGLHHLHLAAPRSCGKASGFSAVPRLHNGVLSRGAATAAGSPTAQGVDTPVHGKPCKTAPDVQHNAAVLPPLFPLAEEFDMRHAFSTYSNWIVPGYLMLGRYPFVEPRRCESHEQGQQQLQQILDAGITTFVCLQAELPRQEGMPLQGIDGFSPYLETALRLHSAKSTSFEMDASASLPASQLQFAHWPIIDLSVPSRMSLEAALDDLESRLLGGEKLYVHCWGGRGRAGTIGACLLARLYSLSAKETLERVGRAFQLRGDYQYRSPETDEQQHFVQEYCESRLRQSPRNAATLNSHF